METKGKSSALIIGVQKGLEPLMDALEAHESFVEFLGEEFGWDVSGVNAGNFNSVVTLFDLGTNISNLVTLFFNLDNNIGSVPQILQDILDEVLLIIEKIQNLVNGSFALLPPPMDGSTNFWNEFPKALLDWLVIDVLEGELPVLVDALNLLGLTTIEDVVPSAPFRTPYTRYIVHWDKIGPFLIHPDQHLKETYKWDHPVDPFDYKKLFVAIANLAGSVRLPARLDNPPVTLKNLFYAPANPALTDLKSLEIPVVVQIGQSFNTYAQLGVMMMPITPVGNTSAEPTGFLITPSAVGTISAVANPSDADVKLGFSGGFDATGFFRVEVRPGDVKSVVDPSVVNFFAELFLSGKPANPYLLIGSADSHRLELDSFRLSAEARGPVGDPEFIMEVGTDPDDSESKLRFVFQPSDGDSFVNKIMGTNPLILELDGRISWSSKYGLGISGHAGFSISIPINKEIGPLTLNTLRIAGSAGTNGDGKIAAGIGIKVEIGPVTAIVDDIGAAVKFVQKGPGDPAGLLGNVDMDWSFKPPSGLGLVIDSAAVKGGGYLFFNPDEARYGGALELNIKDKIALKAIGILTTRLPGNQPGWSLLLMITAEFQPIQLGFGFTLNGVGGLVALHRTMNFNVLRDGVRNNSLDNILFPADPVANISSILSSLESAFPIQENRYSFGPMAIIGWGTPTLITAELGLFIEVPDPVRLAIIGVIKALLPDENKALLKLQINFIGTIDFEAKYITFDASLFDSQLLWMTLSGDMAFRLRWGDDPIFVLSVGGFHPSFSTAGLNVPSMNRITVNLLGGDNPRLTLTTYFAVTSNTVQFGAAIDFYYRVTDKIRVVGYLGFDALFRFSPFYFIISIGASLAVYRNDKCLLGIWLSGSLEGPTPWRVRGNATFTILKIDFTVSFDKTFGDSQNTTLPNEAVMPKLITAITDKANWQAALPAGKPLLVTVRELPNTPGVVVVHPQGAMGVSQKVVPLDFTINKFGSSRPSDFSTFGVAISGSFTTSKLQEFFAPAEFTQLTDGQRLSRKSFEKYNSGVQIQGGEALTSSTFRELKLEYETIYMDSRYKPVKFISNTQIQNSAFRAFIGNNAAAKSKLGSQQKPVSLFAPAKLKVQQESYAVAKTADLAVYNSLTASSQAEAEMLLENLLQQQPELEGKIQVVSSFELA